MSKKAISVTSSQAVVLAGMHRSNTSLIAKAFHQAGLFMGDQLMPPSRHNREGYFEDKDIIAFHNRMLEALGYSFWDVADSRVFSRKEIPEHFYREAEALLHRKFAGKAFFGWKDPRTTLFLPFWKEVLPNARFVLAYRRPMQTLRSLVRRGDFSKRFPYLRPLQAWYALRVWACYNQLLIDFAEQHPESCLLVKTPDAIQDTTTEQALLAVITDDWGLPLPELSFQKVVNPQLLTVKPVKKYRWMLHLNQRAAAVFERLETYWKKNTEAYEGTGVHKEV